MNGIEPARLQEVFERGESIFDAKAVSDLGHERRVGVANADAVNFRVLLINW